MPFYFWKMKNENKKWKLKIVFKYYFEKWKLILKIDFHFFIYDAVTDAKKMKKDEFVWCVYILNKLMD